MVPLLDLLGGRKFQLLSMKYIGEVVPLARLTHRDILDVMAAVVEILAFFGERATKVSWTVEEEVEKDGARIFVEPKALMHVVGTTMDFVEDDLSSEFVFHNPNAEAACGCGESFTVGKGK